MRGKKDVYIYIYIIYIYIYIIYIYIYIYKSLFLICFVFCQNVANVTQALAQAAKRGVWSLHNNGLYRTSQIE